MRTDLASAGGPHGPPERLESARARRIVTAMRAAVAHRGIAGATFDQVARQAGVSRGLLHYHFGSKERLLVEVIRFDIAERSPGIEAGFRAVGSADELAALVARQIRRAGEEDPDAVTFLLEMLTASRRNDELRGGMAKLFAELRGRVADVLGYLERENILCLRHAPETVASALIALGDGLIVRLATEPERDHSGELEVAADVARFLLGAPDPSSALPRTTPRHTAAPGARGAPTHPDPRGAPTHPAAPTRS